jgi:hypothetical protein
LGGFFGWQARCLPHLVGIRCWGHGLR